MAANDRKRRPTVTDPRADERRRSLLIKIGATVVVVVIAVAIGVWLIVTKDDGTSSSASSAGPLASATSASGTSGSGSGSTTPTVVTDTGAYRVNGVKTPKATLTLIEDFQCPACKQFETIFGSAVKQIRANPNVAVDYKPIAILDRMSSTKYSTRAASASACVAEATADGGDYSVWIGYHDALYAQQPEEQSSGLTDEQLTSIATDAGAPASVSSCIDSGQYASWVTTQTQKAVQDGLQGTPQVELNGKVLELSTPEALIAAVDAAAA